MEAPKLRTNGNSNAKKPADPLDAHRLEINTFYVENPHMNKDQRKAKFAQAFHETYDDAAGKKTLCRYNRYWYELNTRCTGNEDVEKAREKRWTMTPGQGDERYAILKVLHDNQISKPLSKKLSGAIFNKWLQEELDTDGLRMQSTVRSVLEKEFGKPTAAKLTRRVMKYLARFY